MFQAICQKYLHAYVTQLCKLNSLQTGLHSALVKEDANKRLHECGSVLNLIFLFFINIIAIFTDINGK